MRLGSAAQTYDSDQLKIDDILVRVWTIVDHPEPFFPIYARDFSVGLRHFLIPLHSKILSTYNLIRNSGSAFLSVYDIRKFKSKLRPLKDREAINRIIADPEGTPLQLQQETDKLPSDGLFVNQGTVFVNGDPGFKEVYRFKVNLPELLSMLNQRVIEAQNSKSNLYGGPSYLPIAINNALRNHFDGYLTAVDLESMAQFELTNPNPHRNSLQQLILENPNTPESQASQLEIVPRDVAYSIALNLDGDDLRSICTVSHRLNDLFCSNESINFWRNKFVADLGKIDNVNIYALDVLSLRKLYYEIRIFRKVAHLFPKVRTRQDLRLDQFLLFITEIRDSSNKYVVSIEEVQSLLRERHPGFMFVEIPDDEDQILPILVMALNRISIMESYHGVQHRLAHGLNDLYIKTLGDFKWLDIYDSKRTTLVLAGIKLLVRFYDPEVRLYDALPDY